MNRTSTLIAILTLGAAGAAFAQGNPPTTSSANPATGAGQQSQTGGPMGTTGTTAQNSSATTDSGTSNQSSGSMSTGGSNDTNNMAPSSQSMRPARADRN